MARAAARESVTIGGRPERVAVARAFAAAVLGRQHPARDAAVLLLSELVTNSVRHSASGLPGRTVTVTVLSSGEVTRVQVTDRRGSTVPALLPGVSGTEGGGRGLYLVDSLPSLLPGWIWSRRCASWAWGWMRCAGCWRGRTPS